MTSIDAKVSSALRELLMQSLETNEKGAAISGLVVSDIPGQKSMPASDLLCDDKANISVDNMKVASVDIAPDSETRDLPQESTIADVLKAQYEAALAAFGGVNGSSGIGANNPFAEKTVADVLKAQYEASCVYAGIANDLPADKGIEGAGLVFCSDAAVSTGADVVIEVVGSYSPLAASDLIGIG